MSNSNNSAQIGRRAFGGLALALAASTSLSTKVFAQGAAITGAGASFPNPVYQKWGEGAKAAGIQLNYQSVGSGAGINQIRNRTVDFGASDAPLTDQQLEEGKLMQFPTVMGSVVVIVNIPGVETNQLKLTGELVSDIYQGKITKWNDDRLVEMNRDVKLPNLAIAPVYRADGSGTTFVWTSYLSAVSPEFKTKVGASTSVKWPAGAGARGNEGVAGTVKNVRGGIGYVEFAYAKTNNLVVTQLRNKAGKFVKPTNEAFMAAAASADWSVPSMAPSIIDQPGDTTWPIVTATFILLPKNPTDAARSLGVTKFFDWAFTNGNKLAEELDYIPLPDSVHNAIRAAWKRDLKGPDGQPVVR